MAKKRTKQLNITERLTVVLAVAVLLVIGGGGLLYVNSRDNNHTVTSVTECQDEKSRDFRCWRGRYQQIVAQDSPEAALADAEKQYSSNPYIQEVCHQIGHVIGRAAAKKYGDIATAYQHGDDFCASGYYHGVSEAMADQMGTKKIISRINGICQPLREKSGYKLPYYNCVHGLGHGLMAVNYNELFTALEGCGRLTGDWEQNSCYSGVFMENIISLMDPDNHSKYIKENDPVYPCNVVAEKYKYSCYNYQTSHMVRVYKYEFGRVFEQCRRAGEKYSRSCYASLGRDISGYTLTNATKTKDTCLSGTTADAKKYCLEGAVKDFVWQHNSLEKGQELCRLLEDDLKEFCNSTAESYYSLY